MSTGDMIELRWLVTHHLASDWSGTTAQAVKILQFRRHVQSGWSEWETVPEVNR